MSQETTTQPPDQPQSRPPARRSRVRKNRIGPGTPKPKAEGLMQIFWLLCVCVVVYTVLTVLQRPVTFTITGLMVGFCALLPSYLWCKGLAPGLPIFPLFSGSYLITHSLQLLSSYEWLDEYNETAIWRASLTVCGFLLVGTAVWWFWLARPKSRPATSLTLNPKNLVTVLLAGLAMSAFFTMFSNAGWTDFLPGGIATAVRGFIRGPTAFAVFLLAVNWGERKLSGAQLGWFLGLFVMFCVVDACSLYLVSVIGISVMFLVGYASGRKAVPWGLTAIMVCLISILHLGKGEMRQQYWGEQLSERTSIKPWEYPFFYNQWLEASFDRLSRKHEGEEETASILTRANTINLLLQAQAESPDNLPFLYGVTYSIIPSAIVPRIFDPEKTSPHMSTSILNVYYGNQTWEATLITHIGWGMLNESYANFGYAGCFGMALILSMFYTAITRWGIGASTASWPMFAGIFTMSFAIQTEMTASVYITAYLQGFFALWVVVRVFAVRRSLAPAAVGTPATPGGLGTTKRRTRRGRRTRDNPSGQPATSVPIDAVQQK